MIIKLALVGIGNSAIALLRALELAHDGGLIPSPVDAFPASRQYRYDALLRMNREGIPNAVRECIDDPAVTDPDLLRRCHAPTLIIAQENDLLHDADIGRELGSLLPNAELHVFDDQFGLLRDVPLLVQRSAALLSS